MVVARMRMRETTPVTSPTVTVSPTRIGRSNSTIRPETKLAKISCRPKPKPKVTAAASHCTLGQPMPMAPPPNAKPDDRNRISHDGAQGVAHAVIQRQALQDGEFQQARQIRGGHDGHHATRQASSRLASDTLLLASVQSVT